MILPTTSLLLFPLVGCSDSLTNPAGGPTTITDDGPAGLMAQSPARGPIVHHASVGGPDGCGNSPGCDANFSLVANEFADGTVKGQYHDQYDGAEGTHITVDCLEVSGNRAVVGGWVTGGRYLGTRGFTIVVDNGTSAHDPPDQISFTYGGYDASVSCATFQPPFEFFFRVRQGQVRVW